MSEFIFEQHEIIRVAVHANSRDEAEDLLADGNYERFVLSREIEPLFDKFVGVNNTTLEEREQELEQKLQDWKQCFENDESYYS